MKLKTAFKLSALAVALTSTVTAYAATGNNGSIASSSNNWNLVIDPTDPATKDPSAYQFVDLNSSSTSTINPGDKDNRIITQLFQNGSSYYLQVGEGETAKYYNASVKDVDAASSPTGIAHKEVSVTEGAIGRPAALDSLKPILGGLTKYTENNSTKTDTIRVVDSNFLQYGTKETNVDTTTAKAGNLTDDKEGGRPDLTGHVANGIIQTSNPTLISDKTITVGNVQTNGTNAPGQLNTSTEHAVQIKEWNNSGVDKVALLTVGELKIQDAGTFYLCKS